MVWRSVYNNLLIFDNILSDVGLVNDENVSSIFPSFAANWRICKGGSEGGAPYFFGKNRPN